MASNDKQTNDLLKYLKAHTTMEKQKANGKAFTRNFFLHGREDFVTYDGSRKIIGKARIYNVADIDEIRVGYTSSALRNLVKRGTLRPQAEHRCFSIFYNNHQNEEHFIAPNEKSRDMWVKGLQYLMDRTSAQGQGQLIRDEKWISGFFNAADKDGSSTLSKKECRALLKDSFNVEMPDDVFENMFIEADKSGEGVLSYNEFVTFFKLLTRRKDLYEVMQRYAKSGRARPVNEIYLDSNELYNFLNLNKKYLEKPEQVQGVIDAFELNRQFGEKGFMGIDGFRNLLLSKEFDILDSSNRRQVYQDMTKPLCDYYINTSYNTYLFKSQLIGAANPEAYSRVLFMGGRVVDLDCYDGKEEEGPIVKRGLSIVGACTFESIIQTMKPNLFRTSPYPVILNIENHCSAAQQLAMVKILKKYFGDQLVTKPLPGRTQTTLPSPEELKNRVLIRSKITSKSKRGAFDDEDSVLDALTEEVIPELTELLVYLQNVPWLDYDHAKANYTSIHSTSLDEKHLIKLSEEDPVQLVKQTAWRILRSYPGGLRQDSSNPDPVLAWNVGVQMVAMNYQTSDDMMALNYGKFLDNGGCGYILKPDYLIKTEFNPYHSLNNLDQHLTYTITVISGQFLPRSDATTKDIPDPYVKISTHGVICDNRTQRTQHVNNNGLDPFWNETFEFSIKFPQMCLIYFSVMDYDPLTKDDRMAYLCAPIKMIQPGYRHIHLRANNNDQIHSTIFVYVEIKEDKRI